jgi:Ribbon-helix-helix protein, copG family
MRTTVTLDDDVSAAIEQLRRERGMGPSAAINELVRRGLARAPERQPFVQETSALALRIDVTNVAEALELLDGPGAA